MYPKYLYHPVEAPVVVYSEDEHLSLGEDWKESPAECDGFLEREDVAETIDMLLQGRDVSPEMEDQIAGNFYSSITDYCNGLIQLEKMKKAELVEFAEKHLGLELKPSMRKAEMVSKIKEEAEPEADFESV